MSLTLDQVQRIAHLARIEVSEAEALTTQGHLNGIFQLIEQMQAVDTTGVEPMAHAQDLPGYFRVPPDLRDLNYGKFMEQGEQRISDAHDYTSGNTERLDVEGMQQLLLKLDFIRDLVAGRPAIPVD